MTSWKTTLCGVLSIAAILIDATLKLLNNGSPDWTLVGASLVTAAGLVFSKDQNVSNSPNPVAAASVPSDVK